MEYVWAGAIGDVREVHIWTNRPRRLLAAGGIPRPESNAAGRRAHAGTDRASRRRLAAAMAGNYPKPTSRSPGISSSAPRRAVDYHPVYHPFNWRGWVDWGAARSATWART